jgi:RHS repeat-associated protein
VDLGGGSQSLYFNAGSNRINGASYDSAGNLLNDGTHAYTFTGDNVIRSVDAQSAYVYNGEGQRVRKLLGQNLRFVYGIAGELIAEFDGASGALKKEYIYGDTGLVATIEPTAVNSNGTRYSTADHLGSPRVLTNSSAGVVSRHDYMPFGEELGAGVGGRTAGMGFSVADGLRQKFTSYERDSESSLDYAGARFYSSSQGRFTSVDPLMASAVTANPQTLNRYSYVSNSPLNIIDPTGMFGINLVGGCINGGGIPLVSLTSEMPQQPTQAQSELTATVKESPVEFDFNLPLDPQNPNAGPFFTGFDSLLTITLFEDGKPVAGATGTEAVTGTKGEAVEQNPKAVTTNGDGQVFDLVTRGAHTETKLDRATAVAVFQENALKPVDVTTQMVLTLKLPKGGSVEITFYRRLTNLDENGNLRPAGPIKTGGPTNFRITISSVTVKRLL